MSMLDDLIDLVDDKIEDIVERAVSMYPGLKRQDVLAEIVFAAKKKYSNEESS